MTTFQTRAELRTKNELNQHEHWRNRYRRAREQRETMALLVRSFRWDGRPLVITVTRVAPSTLSIHDALPASLKHVIDGIADGLGLDPRGPHDDDPRLTWRHAQRRGRGRRKVDGVVVPAEWAVEVRIQVADEVAA